MATVQFPTKNQLRLFDKRNSKFPSFSPVNCQPGELHPPPVEHGPSLPRVVRDVPVHQRVLPDEVEHGVRERPGVRDAGARAGLGHAGGGHREPH